MLLMIAEVAVAVAVPVDADIGAAVSAITCAANCTTARRARRRRVADRVGNADALRAGVDRALVDRAQRLGIGARRVLGDVHHLEAFLHRERDRFFGVAQQPVERPALGVLADRATSR